MMKCEDIQLWLSEYWDLPEDAIRKHQVNQHIKTCSACKEEFKIWQESTAMLKTYQTTESMQPPIVKTSAKVMSRIYKEDTWRVPVPQRMYQISFRTRKIMAFMMAFFLAMFIYSLFHSFSGSYAKEANQPWVQTIPVAQTINVTFFEEDADSSVLQGVPVASISEPLVLRVGYVNSDPNYWLAVSLLGIVSIILLMAWFSRVRS